MPNESETEGRRANERAPITLRVDYKRLNTFFADYTKNISKGGTFIHTTRPLDVGTKFVFVLSVHAADKHTVLELQGIVKWVIAETETTAEKPAGMGIEFVFDTAADKQRVEKTVADLMEETLGSHLAGKLLRSPG